MKRIRMGWWITVFVVFLSVAGLAYAADSIQLVVNGRKVDTDVPPMVKDGRTLVPIRWVAEALGAEVVWDAKTQTVYIQGGSIPESVRQQINMLEKSFPAETPKQAVTTWANAVKEGNGAVQFAMLSADLQERIRSQYEQIQWVTGPGDPWVDKFQITSEKNAGNSRWNVEVEFQLKTSKSKAGTVKASLVVQSFDGVWRITEVLGGPEGVPNVPPGDLKTTNEQVRSIIGQLRLGLTQGEVERQFGSGYNTVAASADGHPLWRYDYVVKDGYKVAEVILGGVVSDAVDVSGLANGALALQLFVSWDDSGRVDWYSVCYAGQDGKVYDYRFYGDGKIKLQPL